MGIAVTMQGISIDSAVMLLTDKILGYNDSDLEATLKVIADDLGLCHIAYLRFSPEKSADTTLLTSAVTYSIPWQNRYFEKEYVVIDPVVARGREAVIPFDWDEISSDDPKIQAFFNDASNYGVGRNGLSIPIRNRRGAFGLVSFSSNHTKTEWCEYKRRNTTNLQIISALIDSAASINSKPSVPAVKLSRREEQCLIWAARGKTYQDIAEILNISYGSVKVYLDTARHKLNSINLTHAVAVAVATGVIPAKALR